MLHKPISNAERAEWFLCGVRVYVAWKSSLVLGMQAQNEV